MSNGSIGIVDYGMGNLHSVRNAIEHMGGSCALVSNPFDLAGHGKIILPGVGAFAQAIACLHNTGMTAALNERRQTGTKILGVCLGMQLMCRESEEDGLHEGLGWFDARVVNFEVKEDLPVPHVGWNNVNFAKADPILDGLQTGADAYFVHSLRVECKDKGDQLGTTDYGSVFDSMIQRQNLWGFQFHPEKSQEFGLGLFYNFTKLPC